MEKPNYEIRNIYTMLMMRTLEQITLIQNQYEAVEAIQKKVISTFDIAEMIIFGSVARGEADCESDLDILIVTMLPLNRTMRHQITDMACEINLQFDTNLSTLVVDKAAWQSGLFSVLPIRKEILAEGILL